MIPAASDITEWYKVSEAMTESAAWDALCYIVGDNRDKPATTFQLVIEWGGYSVVKAVMMVGGALFDLLSIGEGMGRASSGAENPLWGLTADGLRVLTVAGPIMRFLKFVRIIDLPKLFILPGEASLRVRPE